MRLDPDEPASVFLRDLAIVVVGLAALGFAAIYGLSSKLTTLQKDAAVWTLWGIQSALVTTLAGAVILFRPFYRWFGRRWLRWAVVLGTVGFALTLIAPRTHRILFDEVIYENIAQSIALTGKATIGNYANVTGKQMDVIVPWVNKQPHGHPYVLSLFFRLFGVNDDLVPWIGRLESAMTVATLFLVVMLALSLRPGAPKPVDDPESYFPASAAAVVLALTPISIWWSSTGASEPVAALMDAMAVLATVFYSVCIVRPELKTCQTAAGVMMAGALGGAVYFRPESPMIAGVAAASLAIFGPALKHLRTYIWLMLAAILAAPQFLHTWSVHNDRWGAKDGARFSFGYIKSNLLVNAGYFWDGHWFPPLFSLLALAGLYQAYKWSPRILLWGISWFLASWGIFVLFYAGSYNYGADSRYAVISGAPVAVFVGAGAALMLALLRRFVWLIVPMTIALALHWSKHVAFATEIGRPAAECRLDLGFVRRHAADLPQRSLVLSDIPFYWELNGVSAAQTRILQSRLKNMPELLRRYPGGVYLHWGYWTVQRPNIGDNAKQVVEGCHGELLWCDSIGAYKYGIIRLSTPWALSHLAPSPMAPPAGPKNDLEALFPSQFSLFGEKRTLPLTHPQPPLSASYQKASPAAKAASTAAPLDEAEPGSEPAPEISESLKLPENMAIDPVPNGND